MGLYEAASCVGDRPVAVYRAAGPVRGDTAAAAELEQGAAGGAVSVSEPAIGGSRGQVRLRSRALSGLGGSLARQGIREALQRVVFHFGRAAHVPVFDVWRHAHG